jgi:hypothetical protein
MHGAQPDDVLRVVVVEEALEIDGNPGDTRRRSKPG